jgi:hypothetical protein
MPKNGLHTPSPAYQCGRELALWLSWWRADGAQDDAASALVQVVHVQVRVIAL